MTKAKPVKEAIVTLIETSIHCAKAQGIRRILIVSRKPLAWSLFKNLPPNSPSILLAIGKGRKNSIKIPTIQGLDVMVMDLPNVTPQEWLERCLQDALKFGKLKRGERLLCLHSLASPTDIDSLSFIRLKEKAEYVSFQKLAKLSDTIPPEVLSATVNLAMDIAKEGREGKPVGCLFVVGDYQKVLEASRPMILNPFQGYQDDQKRITDPELAETVKEIAQLDGAFIIRNDGVIVSAGRYLDTPAKGVQMKKGLGARHVAAASISKTTDAVAIAISSSSRTVRIYRKGKMAVESKPLQGLWI